MVYQVSTTWKLTSKSVLSRSDEIRSFEQKLEKDTVPLELIMLHMRLLVPELLKDKEVQFPIYASMLALNWKGKNTPISEPIRNDFGEPIKRRNYSAPWGAKHSKWTFIPHLGQFGPTSTTEKVDSVLLSRRVNHI